ncbi:MAG TPA: hypothetical protein VFA27_11850 [Vicinamibacterales bacterium]|nr:hypothetical protein [Vicinamibacterales bacterium]
MPSRLLIGSAIVVWCVAALGADAGAAIPIEYPRTTRIFGSRSIACACSATARTRRTALKVPNACASCHKDRTDAWAIDALKGWGYSAWRIG